MMPSLCAPALAVLFPQTGDRTLIPPAAPAERGQPFRVEGIGDLLPGQRLRLLRAQGGDALQDHDAIRLIAGALSVTRDVTRDTIRRHSDLVRRVGWARVGGHGTVTRGVTRGVTSPRLGQPLQGD